MNSFFSSALCPLNPELSVEIEGCRTPSSPPPTASARKKINNGAARKQKKNTAITPPHPCEPPENLPSVMSATELPKPAPMMAEEGVSISGMPGPPLGPSYRITTTMPGVISFRARDSSMSSSESYTLGREAADIKGGSKYPVGCVSSETHRSISVSDPTPTLVRFMLVGGRGSWFL